MKTAQQRDAVNAHRRKLRAVNRDAKLAKRRAEYSTNRVFVSVNDGRKILKSYGFRLVSAMHIILNQTESGLKHGN